MPRDPPDHHHAGRQPFEVPLPGARRGLVEVVDVEQQPSLGRGEHPEVRHVGVSAQLDVQAGRGGPGEIGGHEARRAAQEGEGRLEHPPPPHRHEVGDPSRRSRRRGGRWDRAVCAGGSHRALARARHDGAAPAAGSTLPVPPSLRHRSCAPSPKWLTRNDTGRRPPKGTAPGTHDLIATADRRRSLARPTMMPGGTGVGRVGQAAPCWACWRRIASTLSSMRTFLPTTTPPVSSAWL